MLALYIVLGIIVLFLAVIFARAFMFTPKKGVEPENCEVSFDGDRAIKNLAELVRCKTVSYYSREDEDEAEFKKLIDLLPTLYPNVFTDCEYKELPDRALLFKWKGKNSGAPAVMMAHYDVVPVDESGWEKPPFDAIIENGVMWGRGTLDTKGTLNGVLFSADTLISEGFVPENDIYFAFSGGEEVNGNGAPNIVDYFEKEGITPAIVVDEGGAVVENVFPGVKTPCGLIGIAEKGMMDVEYKAKSPGGHASAPKPNSPVVALSKVCTKIEANPFKAHLTKPVAELFDTLGRHSNLLYRVIFANLWCFKPVLDMMCKKSGGELNALMRTTVAFTRMKGSSTNNVIPPEATMVSNIRLNPMDNMETALCYLNKTVDNSSVLITKIKGMDPSPVSETNCDAYNKVAKAVASTWKGCIVSPYLMVQCSDSRHWGRISKNVYRFSAMDLTAEERATIHGNNERVRLECAKKAVEFYIRLMKQC